MIASPARHLTFEEFEQLPDQPGKLELLRGELIELPPAKRRHNQIAERIAEALRQLRPSGIVHHEMGYKLRSGSWLQPDVSVTHRNQPGDDYYEDAPALAVEVISERNSAAETAGKVEEYLGHGAKEVWVLYPRQQRLWIYRPNGTAESHVGEFRSEITGEPPLNVADFLREA